MVTISKSRVALYALTIGRRRTAVRLHLTAALVAATFAFATATGASADPLSAFLGSLFGQRPAQQITMPSYQTASVFAYAYAPEASQPS